MKKLSILLGLVLLPLLVHSQDLEKVKTWFYENYWEIKNDQEIGQFLGENKEIKERLDNYYYGILTEKHKENVFRMIEGMYWKIANSSTKDRVTEVILKEMNRAKERVKSCSHV